jgi:hypothetical protein
MSKIYIRIILLIVSLQLSIASFAAEPDSVRYKIENFDYLTQFTETNLATYPYIIKQHSKEYAALKRNIRKRILKGEDMESATCDYVFWFFSRYDTHFIAVFF